VTDSVVARKMHRTLEPYHGFVYFAPEAHEAYATLGITDRRMGYFASRAAAMGAVSAEVVIATFFNFSPALVRRAIPAAWAIASPAQLLEARLAGVDAVLRRVLAADLASDEVAEAAELACRAASACRVEGRPLFAGHAALAWPDEPHLQLWLAVTQLREFRGDGHIACLVDQELSGCEALVIHDAMGEIPPGALQSTRDRTDAEWAEATEHLRHRGWLDADGELTEEGRAARLEAETRTDELAMAPWRELGDDACARLRALVRPWSRALVSSGTFAG
jgi:hypothetical protein